MGHEHRAVGVEVHERRAHEHKVASTHAEADLDRHERDATLAVAVLLVEERSLLDTFVEIDARLALVPHAVEVLDVSQLLAVVRRETTLVEVALLEDMRRNVRCSSQTFDQHLSDSNTFRSTSSSHSETPLEGTSE